MTSSKPYLIRAIYEWLLDNRLTPYLMVDATEPEVAVPEQYIEDGKIVLNIAPEAIVELSLSNTAVEFDARFSGVKRHIYVPVSAVRALYSYENGRGMVFGEEDEDDGGDDSTDDPAQPTPPSDTGAPRKGRPNLKIVK